MGGKTKGLGRMVIKICGLVEVWVNGVAKSRVKQRHLVGKDFITFSSEVITGGVESGKSGMSV